MKTKIFEKNKFPYLGGGWREVENRRTRRFAPAYCHCLLLLFLWPMALAAQGGNGVAVTSLAVEAGTVTFNVSWDKNAIPVNVWSDSVWVFVDYNKGGVMTRLPLETGSATLTATSAPGLGKVAAEPENNTGVWVIGNAKTAGPGSFSATVRLLTTETNVAGACAYA
jgi:hypothetical protein